MIYSTTTPLLEVRPERIRATPVSAGVVGYYQPLMSKAVWRPAAGRKLGFLVTQDDSLLGLIFLASPVIRLESRDRFLFPGAPKDFDYGSALRKYMDMSVCIAAQPIGWHWNLGKLMALIAPTLGDYVEAQYGDELKGITTTSLWGPSSQYNRIYRFLGYTSGFGHEHVSEAEYQHMMARLRASGHQIPSASFNEGSRNVRWRRIQTYWKNFPQEKAAAGLRHGKRRGVYFHPAVPPQERPTVVQHWFERWGLPRYERTKNQAPPYTNGLEGGRVA